MQKMQKMQIEIIKKNVSGKKNVEVWVDGEIVFPYPLTPTKSSMTLLGLSELSGTFNVFTTDCDSSLVNDEKISFEGVPTIFYKMTYEEMVLWVENIKRLRKEVADILAKNESQSFIFEV